MTSKDISIICNYQESATPIDPNSKISCIDFNNTDDEEYRREVRMKNRSLAIDALLENKTEEYNNREKFGSQDLVSRNTSGMSTSSVLAYSINLPKPSKFNSHDDLWNIVMEHIEKNTQGNHPFMQKATGAGINQTPSFSHTSDPNKTDHENNQARSRRLLSRVLMASNAIASTLTIGPATFVIIGTDIVSYLGPLSQYGTIPNTPNKFIIGDISGMTVILSTKIKSNKIIVGRSESGIDHGGLIVLNDMNNYYMMETRRTFYKNFIWFEVN